MVRGDLYFTTTAVFLTEMLKLFICSSVMFYQTGSAAGVEIIEIFTVTYVDTLKMSVPAIMYVFQNNLLYIAASNLDAAVFQVSINKLLFIPYISLGQQIQLSHLVASSCCDKRRLWASPFLAELAIKLGFKIGIWIHYSRISYLFKLSLAINLPNIISSCVRTCTS